MKTDKPKIYHIDTLEKLCNVVNPENVITLATDLTTWLFYYQNTIENYRKKYPKQTKGKLNTEIAIASFEWIDDGKNDWLGTKLTNPFTGEITEFNAEELKDNTNGNNPD